MIFRFDDVSINTDIVKLWELLNVIHAARPDANVLLAVSPIVFPGIGERVHPPELTAGSFLAPYYRGTRCGLPDIAPESWISFAGHGLLHVDHRLLGRTAQEMSILTSCALARSSVFVPPYNHYDQRTIKICRENNIELVKFEDGWLHAGYNLYDPHHSRYYCHPYDKTPEQLEAWFQ